MESAARIPVSLVTGFLGSGKTTLIAALLRQSGMQGTAVIVNEIGAVGIDDAIFAQSLEPGDVVLLANGCLCCAVGDDLSTKVWELVCRAHPPQRIVIETSGLADPAPALRRLMGDPRLRLATRVDAMVATVDAVNGLQNLEEQPVALRQCAMADRRLITKADLADAAMLTALSARLRALNPGTSIEIVSHGEIAADRLFGAALYDPNSGRADVDRWLNLDDHHAGSLQHYGNHDIRFSGVVAHDPEVGTWLVEEQEPLDWDKLLPLLGAIVAQHGDRLLRVKGVIRTTGDPRPLVIHGVQRLFHAPARLAAWTRKPATSIVIIGDEGAGPAVALIADALKQAVAVAPFDNETLRQSASITA